MSAKMLINWLCVVISWVFQSHAFVIAYNNLTDHHQNLENRPRGNASSMLIQRINTCDKTAETRITKCSQYETSKLCAVCNTQEARNQLICFGDHRLNPISDILKMRDITTNLTIIYNNTWEGFYPFEPEPIKLTTFSGRDIISFTLRACYFRFKQPYRVVVPATTFKELKKLRISIALLGNLFII